MYAVFRTAFTPLAPHLLNQHRCVYTKEYRSATVRIMCRRKELFDSQAKWSEYSKCSVNLNGY